MEIKDKQTLILALSKLLELSSEEQRKYIKLLQKSFWDDKIDVKEFNKYVSELFYDLEYYVENEEHRKEDDSYFGENKMLEYVKEALRKIKDRSSK